MLTLNRALWLERDRYAYDALAYDKVSQSPTGKATPTTVAEDRAVKIDGEAAILDVHGKVIGYELDDKGRLPLVGSKESLIAIEKPAKTGNPKVGTNVPILKRHIQFMTTKGMMGVPHPQLNPAEWRAANSRNNLLLPTSWKYRVAPEGATAVNQSSALPPLGTTEKGADRTVLAPIFTPCDGVAPRYAKGIRGMSDSFIWLDT